MKLHHLAEIPGAVLVAAVDADRADDGYAHQLEEMTRAADVRFERLRPPVEGGDWNGMLKQGRGP